MSQYDPRFLLDTNVLIQAHRHYYAFDVCPGFWAAILKGFESGQILSTQRVLEELRRSGDKLTDWAESRVPKDFFMDDGTAEVVAQFAPIISWVQAEDFTPAAKLKFANDADGWLVAASKHHGFHLVTLEQHRPERKNPVPIPNVCLQFGVPYCTTFEMLRGLSCKFH